MNTKITAIAALVLATASASSAFASEAFDVDIYRPAVNQERASQAYAQAPTARQLQAERRQSVQTTNGTAQDKAYTGHGSQID